MGKIRVLFVCIHNAARSQMAEAFLNDLGRGKFIAESAGLEPGQLNPLVVKVMKDEGMDISGKKSKSVFDMHNRTEEFDYVITVCDEASAERCPVFPGGAKRVHWSFADPSKLKGTDDEKLSEITQIRDLIKSRIEEFIKEVQ